MNLKKRILRDFIIILIITSFSAFTSAFLLMSAGNNYNNVINYYCTTQGDVGYIGIAAGVAQTEVKSLFDGTVALDSEQRFKEAIIGLDALTNKLKASIESQKLSVSNQDAQNLIDKNRANFNRLEISIVEFKTQMEKAHRDVTAGSSIATLQYQWRVQLQPIYDKTMNDVTAMMASLVETSNYEISNLKNGITLFLSSILSVLLFALGLSVFIALRLARRISNPAKEMAHVTERLSKGDLSVDIEYNSKDEIGMLANSLGKTIDTWKLYISEINRVLSGVAQGNLTVEINTEFEGDFSQIQDSLEVIISSLNKTVLDILSASEQIVTSTDMLSSGAQALSQGATQQASSIEELSGNVMEISEQVRKNANNARSANNMIIVASNSLENGNIQMQEMTSAMSEIANTSNQIGKIIKTIDDIAFQTNILALNAAVEAARAGAAGKGFAVVADEVRNLASKSAIAAKETALLIENSIKAVGNGTNIAAITAKTIKEAVENTLKTTTIISEISDSTSAQSNAISEVTTGLSEISQVIQNNSATAEQSAAASEQLAGQAHMMKELVNEFNLKESNFEIRK